MANGYHAGDKTSCTRCLVKQPGKEVRPLVEYRVKKKNVSIAPVTRVLRDAQCVPVHRATVRICAHEIHEISSCERFPARIAPRSHDQFEKSWKSRILWKKDHWKNSPVFSLKRKNFFEFHRSKSWRMRIKSDRFPKNSPTLTSPVGERASLPELFRNFFSYDGEAKTARLRAVTVPLSFEYVMQSHSRREMIAG